MGAYGFKDEMIMAAMMTGWMTFTNVTFTTNSITVREVSFVLRLVASMIHILVARS